MVKRLGILLLGLGLALQGCTIKKADDADGGDTQEGSDRGPGGVELENEREPGEFPGVDYDDGPELDDSRDALRAIQEADIVQVQGSTLYALSRAGGLSIIDVTDPDSLALIGRYRTQATPFEMYVRGNHVIGLFKDAAVVENDTLMGTVSRIIALDVADPANISEVDSFDLPGVITDSRIVGSILYAAAHEIENCWDCTETPTTTVVSLDVSAPASISEVDRLSFEEARSFDDQGWSKKSITVNDERMYISGVSTENSSTIQVVDISDESGDMVLGDTVDVDGAIFSRWQVDEYLGVLRVISQPPDPQFVNPPVIQTFTINSSSDLAVLGSTVMELPRAEKLRSVRFDGERAFAITFERTDPLFAIDLSDPANPEQVGELELPGFVLHMEPRGDHLIGLGFEPGNDEGGLHVSLFDVSDLTAPTQLQRVNFGPTWSSSVALTESSALVEDENRIHKLFRVLDDLNLILVPFSGWLQERIGCGTFRSGVQIIDFDLAAETLTLRGLAQATGSARRAFLHNDRMFTVSEEQVQVFDITDRDDPVKTSFLPLAQRVHRTMPVGDRLLRITSDWWSRVSFADVVDVADAESPDTGAVLDLAAILHEDPESCEYHNDDPFAKAPMFDFGDHVAIAVVHEDPAVNNVVTDLLVLDVSGDAPVLADQLRLDFEPIETGIGAGIVQIDSALVLQRPGDNVEGDTQDLVLEVVDMSDPSSPELLDSPLARPLAWGTTGLHAVDGRVSSGYFAPLGEDVGYYLDRVDFTDSTNPNAEEPVLFPGLVLGPMGERFLGVDFSWRFERIDETECASQNGEWDAEQDVCWFVARDLQLVSVSGSEANSLSTADLPSELGIYAVHRGDSRFFLPSRTPDFAYEIMVIGTDGDQLATSRVSPNWQPVSPQAQGQSLFYIDSWRLAHLDATDAGSATVTSLTELRGYTGGHLALGNGRAFVSLGESGVQVVELP